MSSAVDASVIVYTRRECCLCHEAIDLLRSEGLEPQLVDIDDHAELKNQFNTCVPVVEIDGKIRFRGRVNAWLLRRLLQARETTHPISS